VRVGENLGSVTGVQTLAKNVLGEVENLGRIAGFGFGAFDHGAVGDHHILALSFPDAIDIHLAGNLVFDEQLFGDVLLVQRNLARQERRRKDDS